MSSSATVALHSSASVEHYTPAIWVEAARYVLGAIDLDPASCELANATVRAVEYYSHGGAEREWYGLVMCNPPGGQVKEFWRRAFNAVNDRECIAVLWVGFSLEQLQTLQRCGVPGPARYPLAIPDRRVAYMRPSEALTLPGIPQVEQGNSPTHGSFFALLGGDAAMRARFADKFSELRCDVTMPCREVLGRVYEEMT